MQTSRTVEKSQANLSRTREGQQGQGGKEVIIKSAHWRKVNQSEFWENMGKEVIIKGASQLHSGEKSRKHVWEKRPEAEGKEVIIKNATCKFCKFWETRPEAGEARM